MKKFFLLLFAAAALTACQQAADPNSEFDERGMKKDTTASCCSTKDGLFLHISSGYDNPHKALMALKMASMMAEDHDVLVYVDIKGVEMLLKTSKDMEYKTFPKLFELLDQLAAKKVTVMACPACLEAAGYKAEDLREGIITAEKDKFFGFTKGRIVTLDY